MKINPEHKKPIELLITLSALLSFGWALVFVGLTMLNSVFDDHGLQYAAPEEMPQVQQGDYENYQKV
jgi:hypothetical protein